MVSSAFSFLSVDLWFNYASARRSLLIHSDLADPWLQLNSVFVINKELARWGLLSWKGRLFMIHTVLIAYIYIYMISYYTHDSIP
jgi:hypothetical protein